MTLQSSAPVIFIKSLYRSGNIIGCMRACRKRRDNLRRPRLSRSMRRDAVFVQNKQLSGRRSTSTVLFFGDSTMQKRHSSTVMTRGARKTALFIALGLCCANGVQAQQTTGTIYGTIQSGQGSTIVVSNNAGFSRTATADAAGRFNISALPVGQYTVTIQRDGQTIGTRNITVLAGAGTDVSFGANGDTSTLETVTVTGTYVHPIDITATDTRSVLTSEQIERLPLSHSAEAIALLAPGAISGAGGYFGNLVSFGGSGVSENAYYINGYFTGEPLSNLGGASLPFGVIAQQETFLGGYSAKFGRSAGGVISQIGKRGTNEWEFGAQVTYAPKSLREDNEDLYLPDIDLSHANANPNLPSTCGDGTQRCQWAYENADLPGSLYSRGKGNETEDWTYSAYVGGPIIKDRLFFFAGAEYASTERIINPTSIGNQRSEHRDVSNPKLYAKLDWNITDNHMVEFTYAKDKTDQDGVFFAYDFDSATEGELLEIVPTPIEQENEFKILRYNGYLTDTLTFSALMGRSDSTNRQINPMILPDIPYIASVNNQDPAIVGDTPILNRQGGYQGRDGHSRTDGIRADLEWVVGDHTLTVGIDNIEFKATNEGTSQVAEYWQYARAANPNGDIVPGLGVGAPGGDGFYVRELRYFTSTDMSLEQKAWYLEDRWQVTDNILLSLGIRNDQFTNKNNYGETYMDAKDQWAPRFGFAWDVGGDSTFKVFANAGRYFLAMPNNVAIRGASASTYTYEYFTYTGIDPNGMPTGLTPVPGVGGAPPPGPVSSNGETGEPVDVLAFAPADLENMYQDEFILGFETMFTPQLMLGAKLTYRELKSAIDDICDAHRMEEKLVRDGIDPASVVVASCYMFNPGGTNTFSLANADGSGRTEVTMSQSDWGFDDGMKRKYSGLDIYLERPFDGKWEARIDYTLSYSKGNTEGQVKSEFGQTNISKTQDWDVAEMMRYSYGDLANDRRHQFKARGSYAITPEWTVGGNIRVQSGMPISCLGYYNPDGSIDENTVEADPVSYGSSYHTCLGSIARPGAVRTPWIRTVDLGLAYNPAIWDKRLTFGLQVFNVFNENKPLQVDVTSQADPWTISNTYLLPNSRQTPRYVMFSAAMRF